MAPGSQATLTARTLPYANCTIAVYYKSGASTASGLESKPADAAGNVSWTWRVGSQTTEGVWRIVVAASKDGQTASAETPFEVKK